MLCLFLALACGYDPTRVVADIYDSLVVLENLSRPDPGPRWIREAGYSERVIEDWEYPSPTHANGGINWLLNQESAAMSAPSWRNDWRQEECFRHPAAEAQFFGTQKEIDEAQRVKVKLTIDSMMAWRHFFGIYAPPGEVITIEIPQALANKKWYAIFNVIAMDGANNNKRLPKLSSMKIEMKDTVNRLAWPLGGCITMEINADAFSDPIDITISGGVLAPWFRYGADTDEDWATRIRHYPGLVACLETGNLMMLVPSAKVRQYTNMSMPMQFYRACLEIMDSTVKNHDNAGGWYRRRSNGRTKENMLWFFDDCLKAGTAYAQYGANYCGFLYTYTHCAFDYNSVLWECWATLHEMGHNFQSGWHFPSQDSAAEVTNNILSMICHSYYSAITINRGVNDQGGMWISEVGHLGGYAFLQHGYVNIDQVSDFHQWLILLHSFGQTKMRQFIRAFSQDELYPKGRYGDKNSFALTGCKVFGVDIRTHMDFMGWEISNATHQMIDEMNLKPWYPIINGYQTGYEIDGEVFETARPWRVRYGATTRFNFKANTKQRSGQGEFEITELRPGRGQWTKIEDGIYDYTPPADPRTDDEWRLVYREKTTGQETIAYGTIKFTVRGNEFKRFTGINAPGNSVLEAYKMTKGREPAASGTGSGIQISTVNADRYVSVCKGSLIAPKTGNYTFYAAPDERALFYLSERPLAGDPDLDKKYLTLIDDRDYHEYNKQYPSDWHMLTEGEQYYFCFVIYNTNGAGGGKIGYVVNSTGNIVDFPSSNVVFEGVDASILSEVNEGWLPKSFEEVKGVDHYYGTLNLPTSVKAAAAPIEQEGRPTSNLIDGRKGDDNNIYVTRWNTDRGEKVIAEYPQEFQFEMHTMSTFDIIYLRRCKAARRVTTENLSVKCDGRVVYTGPYDSHGDGMRDDYVIPVPGMMNCTYVNISFSDNSARWDGLDIEPGVCLQEVQFDTWFDPNRVVPISHPNFVFKNNWTQSRGGAHYNGFSMYGSKGATLEFKLKAGVTQFAIVGDKWVSELGSNVATVTINGRHSGNAMADVTSSNYPKLYKKVLYVMRHMNTAEDVTVKVEVVSGEIGIAGILLREDEMKGALIPLDAESNDQAPGQQDGEGSSVSNSSFQEDSVRFGSQVGIAIVSLCVIALTIVGAVLLRRRLNARVTQED